MKKNRQKRIKVFAFLSLFYHHTRVVSNMYMFELNLQYNEALPYCQKKKNYKTLEIYECKQYIYIHIHKYVLFHADSCHKPNLL